MINGYIITVTNDIGIDAAYRCIDSIENTGSTIDPEIFEATTPESMASDIGILSSYNTRWNWPESHFEDGLDMKTGLYKFQYAAQNQEKVKACSISHARLWKKCVDMDEPIVILESDALFTRKFDYADVQDKLWGALGLNDPRGATRKSMIFYKACIANESPGVYNVPKVDEQQVPQGLAGNSAYIIRPSAAKDLLNGLNEYGLWPNDAYMCKQLWPWLKVTQPFYTKVQGLPSSTKG